MHFDQRFKLAFVTLVVSVKGNFDRSLLPFILLHHVDDDVLTFGLKVDSSHARDSKLWLTVLLRPRDLSIVVNVERIRNDLSVVIEPQGNVVFELQTIFVGDKQNLVRVAVPAPVFVQSISWNEEKRTGALKINRVRNLVADARVSDFDLVRMIAECNQYCVGTMSRQPRLGCCRWSKFAEQCLGPRLRFVA